jgi:hypothetical protein
VRPPQRLSPSGDSPPQLLCRNLIRVDGAIRAALTGISAL